MVCAALAREQGFEVLALTVDYNQRHRVEIDAARRIASSLAESTSSFRWTYGHSEVRR